jgi:hypothetical protein
MLAGVMGIKRKAGMLIVTAVALVAASSSAAAAATPTYDWQPVTGLTGNLSDVALGSGNTPVVVGVDASNHAAVYRRIGNTWTTDGFAQLPAGIQSSQLKAVATDSAGAVPLAWAVGTYTDGTGTHPLVLRSAGTAAWAPVTPPPDMGAPLSISMLSGAGLIGDDQGHVYPLTDPGGVGSGQIGAAATFVPSTSQHSKVGSVTGVSITSATSGFAATADPAGSSLPGEQGAIWDVSKNAATGGWTLSPHPNTDGNFAGISASSSTSGFAIESSGVLKLGTSGWSPDNPNGIFSGATFSDVYKTGALAAIVGNKNGSAVWRYENGWTQDTIAGNPQLNGVAVITATDIWAVGNGGAVQHYGVIPPPPPTVPDYPETWITAGPGNNSIISHTTPRFDFASDDPAAWFECSIDNAPYERCDSPIALGPLSEDRHRFSVRARNADGPDPTPVARQFIVDIPECSPAPRRVADKVKVNTQRGKLRVSFRLKAKARVRAIAVAGSKPIGQTSWVTLNRGRRHLVVRFHGKPTTLRLIAKPLTTASNCDT